MIETVEPIGFCPRHGNFKFSLVVKVHILFLFSSFSTKQKNQVSYDHRSYERNLSNCVEKPEKVRTSTGFEAVTSRYRCDALTN